MRKNINFSDESIDITKQSSKYLRENNFYYNSLEKNFDLLEEALINYSIIKLFSWDVEIDESVQLDNLDNICCLINSNIPTKEQQISFFTQYVHCILYTIGVISKQQKQIDWLKEKNIDSEIEFEIVDNQIVKIITNNDTLFYQLPYKLLEKFKNYFQVQEKNPVLKK